jgi:S-adenosylmethionine/arginine decarboxylase-like enzyme
MLSLTQKLKIVTKVDNMHWGYHLMLDCSGCVHIDSRDNIYKFVKDLIKEIDMVAHGEPVIEYLLPGDPKQGYSLMQLITTSNICGHFMELDGTAYFDVFSCKKFEISVAENVVKKYFNPKKIKVNFLTRHAD